MTEHNNIIVALFLTFVFLKRAQTCKLCLFVVFVTVKNILNILLVSSKRAECLSSQYYSINKGCAV